MAGFMPNRPRKIPPTQNTIETSKRLPKYLGRATLENKHMAWRFSRSDNAGPYDCSNLSHEEYKQLWDRLREFETKNPSQLRDTGSFHSIPISEFCKEARDRLMEIQVDDLEELYSFRIDAMCRIYCMKWENILSILWWDKKHKAYPIPKSHT